MQKEFSLLKQTIPQFELDTLHIIFLKNHNSRFH